MYLSDKNFLDKVEDYTSKPLQRKVDITKIIDLVRSNGKEDRI